MVVVALLTVGLLIQTTGIAKRLSVRLAVHCPATVHVEDTATEWVLSRVLNSFELTRIFAKAAGEICIRVVRRGQTSLKMRRYPLALPQFKNKSRTKLKEEASRYRELLNAGVRRLRLIDIKRDTNRSCSQSRNEIGPSRNGAN
jgi:hypothetical protein